MEEYSNFDLIDRNKFRHEKFGHKKILTKDLPGF
jgi:hypothetical protein